MKKRVAVLFGGRSPEHDVSVYTGINALESLDQSKYTAFPVYVSLKGEWLVGDSLRDRRSYIPRGPTYEALTSVTLDVVPSASGCGTLIPRKSVGLFSKAKSIEFDVALLAMHGASGENGGIQGLLDFAHVPYTGMRALASNVFMDKAVTKDALRGRGIQMLPHVLIEKPASGMAPSTEALTSMLAGMTFPVIVKPVHLGSSVAVSRATSIEEVRMALPPVFKLDAQAMVEPFVENLVEYYVAVRRDGGVTRTSAIERPKRSSHVLDFVSKYGSGDDGVSGMKRAGVMTADVLARSRDINPSLPAEFETNIRKWAATSYEALAGTGAPRIDFLSNGSTGELWLNEVNPCPGWFGSYLWEAAEKPMLYPDLLDSLIDEALQCHRDDRLPDDPTLPGARMFENRP